MFGRGNLGGGGRTPFISIREHFVFGGIFRCMNPCCSLSLIKYLLHGSEYNIEKYFVTMRNIFYEPKASENMACE